MAYTNVSYRQLHLCFSVDGGKLSSSCPMSHIVKYLTFSIHYVWSDRLRRTDVYSKGVLSAIYIQARRKAIVILLHN